MAFLAEAQWWPAERARDFQLASVRRICEVAQRTPFYRQRFGQAGFSPADLKDLGQLTWLPCLDRSTVRDRLADMCAVAPTARGVDYVSTGGTSGQPIGFYIGAGRSAVEYAYLVSGWQRAGFTVGAPMAVFRGRVVPANRDGLRHEYDPVLRHHYYSSFHLSEECMARYLGHLAGLGPCFLHVYPSSADALARFISSRKLTPPTNILGILAESEIVYPEQRALAEATFGGRYFSSYGMTEKLVAAAECEHSTMYHVWPTYGYCELLDEQELPITTPGCRGEIVATGFINEVVPFIRYRTGDYATFVAERCSACGREHILLDDIRGHRIQETLIAADGSGIAWTAINMHDDSFAGVLRFQFLQERPGLAVLRVVPRPGFNEEDAMRIHRNLERKLSGRLDITVSVVDEIRSSPSGKAIYVDQRIGTSDEG